MIMLPRFSFLFVILLGTLSVICGASVFADDIKDGGENGMSGVYELKEVVAAGVYSGEDAVAAEELLGTFLTIHGKHVVLPTNVLCHITTETDKTLRNDRESFGTAGGSWSDIYLAADAEGQYDVFQLDFDCEGPFFSVIAQPERDTYLLQYWSVYFVLGRSAD